MKAGFNNSVNKTIQKGKVNCHYVMLHGYLPVPRCNNHVSMAVCLVNKN